jgi:hypothetical protein
MIHCKCTIRSSIANGIRLLERLKASKCQTIVSRASDSSSRFAVPFHVSSQRGFEDASVQRFFCPEITEIATHVPTAQDFCRKIFHSCCSLGLVIRLSGKAEEGVPDVIAVPESEALVHLSGTLVHSVEQHCGDIWVEFPSDGIASAKSWRATTSSENGLSDAILSRNGNGSSGPGTAML